MAAQTPAAKRQVPKLITSKEMTLHEYPDVFEGLASSQDQIMTSRLNPIYHPSKHLADQSPIHLKEKFQQEINKMLQAGVLAPVHEATPWINSFVLVESKDKLGNLKLYICLDPTNLNKAITREPITLEHPKILHIYWQMLAL